MYGYVSLDYKTEWKYESNENMVVDVRAFFRWKSWMGCESSMSCLNALKFKFHSCYLPYFSSYITLAFNFRSMCRISKEISYNINVYQINQWRILCTFISFEGNKHMICKKKWSNLKIRHSTYALVRSRVNIQIISN